MAPLCRPKCEFIVHQVVLVLGNNVWTKHVNFRSPRQGCSLGVREVMEQIMMASNMISYLTLSARVSSRASTFIVAVLR